MNDTSPTRPWSPCAHALHFVHRLSGTRTVRRMGFMSTSRSKHAAMEYAKMSGVKLVFEVQQGMVARGADISWMSMYPAEDEVLFPPLCACEVKGSRIEGSIVVVELVPGIAPSALKEPSLEDQEANALAEQQKRAAEAAKLKRAIDEAANARARWLNQVSNLKVSVAEAARRAAERAAIKAQTLADAARQRAEQAEEAMEEMVSEMESRDKTKQGEMAENEKKLRLMKTKDRVRLSMQDQRDKAIELQKKEMKEQAEKAVALALTNEVLILEVGSAESDIGQLEGSLVDVQLRLGEADTYGKRMDSKVSMLQGQLTMLQDKFDKERLVVTKKNDAITKLEKELASAKEMANMAMKGNL